MSMGAGVFFVGLIIFALGGVWIRSAVLAHAQKKADDLAKRIVPKKTVIYRDDGSVFFPGDTYISTSTDHVLPLNARHVECRYNADPSEGIRQTRLVNVAYVPDTDNLQALFNKLREVGGLTHLDDAIKQRCGMKLRITPRPTFTDIEDAYGIRFTVIEFPEEIEDIPSSDDNSRKLRYVEEEFRKMLASAGVGLAHGFISSLEKGTNEIFEKHPEVNTEEGRKHLTDLAKSFLDRVKSSQ